MRKVIAPIATILSLLLLWEIAVRGFDIPGYILPAPSSVFAALFSNFNDILFHSGVTLIETLLGLAIAAALGAVIAILMDGVEFINDALHPLLIVSQTIPIIVLAPIFVIYFGFGLMPKILVVVLMCFFPIVINFSSGLSATDQNKINLVKSFGASRLQIYTKVKIPSSLNSLFSGLRIAATYSVSGAVVGEWLASTSGLGYFMLKAKNGFMLDKVFASVLMVIILSLLLNALIAIIKYISMPYLRKE